MTYDMKRVAAIQKVLREWFSDQGHQLDSSLAVIEVECSDGEGGHWTEEETIDLRSLAEHLDKELNK